MEDTAVLIEETSVGTGFFLELHMGSTEVTVCFVKTAAQKPHNKLAKESEKNKYHPATALPSMALPTPLTTKPGPALMVQHSKISASDGVISSAFVKAAMPAAPPAKPPSKPSNKAAGA